MENWEDMELRRVELEVMDRRELPRFRLRVTSRFGLRCSFLGEGPPSLCNAGLILILPTSGFLTELPPPPLLTEDDPMVSVAGMIDAECRVRTVSLFGLQHSPFGLACRTKRQSWFCGDGDKYLLPQFTVKRTNSFGQK